MSSYSKLEKIAEAHNVDVHPSEDEIQLWGRTEDLEKVRDLIEDDYLIRADDRPSEDGRDVLYLYSGRVNWAKRGY